MTEEEVIDIEPRIDLLDLNTTIQQVYEAGQLAEGEATARAEYEKYKSLAQQWAIRFQDYNVFRRAFIDNKFDHANINANFGSIANYDVNQNYRRNERSGS